MEFIIMGAAFLLLAVFVLLLECRALRQEVDCWVGKAEELCALIYEGRETICSLEFELSAVYDDCVDYRELFEATLAEREALSDQAFGLLGDLVDLRQELADAEREIAWLKADVAVQFSGEQQGMRRRLFGGQSDVPARRGKRDRDRYYR